VADYGESYKKHKSARALASAVINGTSFRTDGCYFLTTSTDTDDVVAILDTNAPVGPVSGRAIWRFEVQAHPWGQEVAERVWDGLEWEEVTEDSEGPGSDVGDRGWSCRLVVRIEY